MRRVPLDGCRARPVLRAGTGRTGYDLVPRGHPRRLWIGTAPSVSTTSTVDSARSTGCEYAASPPPSPTSER
jgi:hypothetical protein